jgi:uracil-DNA glycosylase
MGFCYPGKGKSGDLPPRPECAPQWHQKLLDKMPNLELIILIGMYSQKYYLKEKAKRTLTETVTNYNEYLPRYLPLPHPSPRNRFWLSKNPWFEEEVIPALQEKVHKIL